MVVFTFDTVADIRSYTAKILDRIARGLEKSTDSRPLIGLKVSSTSVELYSWSATASVDNGRDSINGVAGASTVGWRRASNLSNAGVGFTQLNFPVPDDDQHWLMEEPSQGPPGQRGEPGATVAGGATYYMDGASDIGGYEAFERIPPTAVEEDESAVCVGGGSNTWGTPVLIDSYASPLGDPGVSVIPAGTWEFHSYGYKSDVSGDCRFQYKVYTRTAGGSETLLFETYSNVLETTTTYVEDSYYYSPHTMIDPTDRVVVKVYAQTNSNSNRTVHLLHSGTTHASHVLTPIAVIGTDPLVIQSLEVKANAEFWTGQDGGWKDMIGNPTLPNAGPTIPTWTQIGATPFYGSLFAINDQLWFTYHIQHDYSIGTDIYLHTHWIADGVDANTVKWEFTYTYAKGHNQANYNLAGTTVTVEQASPSQYRHMTSEIAAAIVDANFEPDGILLVRVRRITNGGVNNADGIFLLTADCHYQMKPVATKNRTPNFYT